MILNTRSRLDSNVGRILAKCCLFQHHSCRGCLLARNECFGMESWLILLVDMAGDVRLCRWASHTSIFYIGFFFDLNLD